MRKKDSKSSNKLFILALLGLIILFLISFSTSAWIYIKSNDLVFSDSIEDYEEKVKLVDETEARIAELEEQVERYKSLYEGAVKDNKALSASVYKSISATAETEKEASDNKTESTATAKKETPNADSKEDKAIEEKEASKVKPNTQSESKEKENTDKTSADNKQDSTSTKESSEKKSDKKEN